VENFAASLLLVNHVPCPFWDTHDSTGTHSKSPRLYTLDTGDVSSAGIDSKNPNPRLHICAMESRYIWLSIINGFWVAAGLFGLISLILIALEGEEYGVMLLGFIAATQSIFACYGTARILENRAKKKELGLKQYDELLDQFGELMKEKGEDFSEDDFSEFLGRIKDK
jgi:hypothetical protein